MSVTEKEKDFFIVNRVFFQNRDYFLYNPKKNANLFTKTKSIIEKIYTIYVFNSLGIFFIITARLMGLKSKI